MHAQSAEYYYTSCCSAIAPSASKSWLSSSECPSEASYPPESFSGSVSMLSCEELYRLPFFRLNIDSIYKEALDAALSLQTRKKQPKIEEFEFQVSYETFFGQELYLTGAGPLLGCWRAERRALPLRWTEGHIWVINISVYELSDSLSYKFLVKSGGKVLRWEGG